MHVVTTLSAPTPICGGALSVALVPAARDNLVWVVHGETRAVLLDGPDVADALAYIDARGLTLDAVLVTHTHGDHTGIVKDLAHRGRLDGVRVIGPRKAAADVPHLNEPVQGGEHFTVLEQRVEVLDTEGHIDGHVSYVMGDAVFCGDTLFTGGCGRMFVGPPALFLAGLLRLAALPDDTRVFCGHEYTEDNLRFALTVEPSNAALHARMDDVRARRATGACCVPETMGVERATNPFLRGHAPELVQRVARATGTPLEDPVAVFAATRALKDSGAYKRP